MSAKIETGSTAPEGDAERGWRPLVEGAVKKVCVADYEAEPILERVGITMDGIAALCIERYFGDLVREIAKNLKATIPQRKENGRAQAGETKAEKKRGAASRDKKADESTGGAKPPESKDATSDAKSSVEKMPAENSEPGDENQKTSGDEPPETR